MSPNDYHESLGAPSFEVCGFCTLPSLAVGQGIARLLGGVFCEKLKFMVF